MGKNLRLAGGSGTNGEVVPTKLASYNVENLFLRAKAMNKDTWSDGSEVLGHYAELNRLLGQKKYTPATKTRILELMHDLGIHASDESAFVILRRNRGKLVRRPTNGPIEVIAEGRADWIGWLELKTEAVNEVATQATAQVIRDVGADVLGVIEAESRPALVRFSDSILPAVGATPYEHIMLIDGNDERGIDVGLMTRQGYEIRSMLSHVDDEVDGRRVFSRDCAEYHLTTPTGAELVVLVNHFKSKGYGSYASSNARRLAQAERVKAIYEGLVAAGNPLVAVLGDFNDTPDSAPLKPLLQDSDLRDISEHDHFDDGGRPGTFGTGAASNKIDYILLSPDLFAATTRGGIFRMGVWGGKNGTIFPHYPEITKEGEAASDHAAIWAEINV